MKFELDLVIWIGLSQDGDNVIAFVNVALNIWFQKRWREFLDYMRK
jgi:hypothetical protein